LFFWRGEMITTSAPSPNWEGPKKKKKAGAKSAIVWVDIKELGNQTHKRFCT
jgi:hypothetical protein